MAETGNELLPVCVPDLLMIIFSQLFQGFIAKTIKCKCQTEIVKDSLLLWVRWALCHLSADQSGGLFFLFFVVVPREPP